MSGKNKMIQNFVIREIWFLKFDFMWLISTYRVNLNWSPIELTYLETCLGEQLQVDLVFWKSFCHFHSDSTDEFVVSKPWLIHPIVFDYERANEKFKNNLWNQIDSTTLSLFYKQPRYWATSLKLKRLLILVASIPKI